MIRTVRKFGLAMGLASMIGCGGTEPDDDTMYQKAMAQEDNRFCFYIHNTPKHDDCFLRLAEVNKGRPDYNPFCCQVRDDRRADQCRKIAGEY